MYFSLWFKSNHDQWFREKIQELSQAYQGIIVDPHVTLLGKVELPEAEVIQKARIFSQKVRPFKVHLNKYAKGETVTQCVFALAEMTSDLEKINHFAQDIFGKTNPMFHLSFLYSSVPQNLREEIIKNLGSIDIDFKVTELSVVLRQGTTEKPHWIELVCFPLETA